MRINGYTTGRANNVHARLRPAPYLFKPYDYDPQTSVNSGPPTRICVTGLDTLTPSSSVERLFSSFGDIAECQLAHSPHNGSSLGICLIRFRDSKSLRGGIPATAARAAKRAYDECASGQHRIGQNTLKVALDRDGTRGREIVLKRLEEMKARSTQRLAPQRPMLPTQRSIPTSQPKPFIAREEPQAFTAGPPPDAPKGPASRHPRQMPPGTSSIPTTITATAPTVISGKPGYQNLVEETSVIEKIERDPYIFLPNESVPVLSTTIPHLRARLKKFSVKDIRCDKSGYYVVFHNSRAGEDECAKCFKACHGEPLFTYTMTMECQKYGNPSYIRPPSPETVQAEAKRKEFEARKKKEDALDQEVERSLRAKNADPVHATVEQLRIELRAKLLEDVKARIAGPALYEFLNPEKHVERRKKLGITGPDDRRARVLIDRALDDSPVGTPEYGDEQVGSRRRALGTKSINLTSLPKMRKGLRKDENSAFMDERRKQKPMSRRMDVRGLHHRLHQSVDEEDSDEEGRSLHRDIEEQDSQTISRMSPEVESDDEDVFQSSRKLKRPQPPWGADDSDEDEDEQVESSVETPQPEQSLEDIRLKRLQDELESLAPKSRKRKRLLEEIAEHKRLKLDIQDSLGKAESETLSISEIKIDHEDVGMLIVKKPKAKRKTKKQILEEQQAAEKAKLLEDFMTSAGVEEVKAPIIDSPIVITESRPSIDVPLIDGVRTGVTTIRPKRTVEDVPSLFLDLDGWQSLVKDDEDLRALQLALIEQSPTYLGHVPVWAWKQKQIKRLNRGGETGPVRSSTGIPGYYVPNSTGSARTEGTKPISQAEKSKYLPHRIKVQKAREEREARAKENPALAAVEAAKAAAAISTANSSSRSNRVNNRRLVADIAAQKQALAISTGDGDALRFNQLKKRKKPVRFARSAIHGWGLYAMENINQNEMIIEYVGDRVRQQVADLRERQYLKSGIGSSYLFRIDEYTVIDATKKGGIARFINHSCTPNCTAKIIKVEGTRRIVIYALRDVQRGKNICQNCLSNHI